MEIAIIAVGMMIPIVLTIRDHIKPRDYTLIDTDVSHNSCDCNCHDNYTDQFDFGDSFT